MSLVDKILLEAKQQRLYEKKLLSLLFKKVKSSNLLAVAYDGASEILQIKFIGGGKYEYYDVPESIFKRLLRAASKGKFFWKNVRNDFDYRKLSF